MNLMNTLTSKADAMRQEFFYLEYKVTPKRSLTRVTGTEAITIELPFKQVVHWRQQQPERYLTDEEIAIELTQAVAIATADRFVVLTQRPIKEREIHSASVLSQPDFAMEERDCDYEDDGIRAWFVA
jgi:hypothetical protein